MNGLQEEGLLRPTGQKLLSRQVSETSLPIVVLGHRGLVAPSAPLQCKEELYLMLLAGTDFGGFKRSS